MLGGLYGDLPPPSSTQDDDNHQSTPATSASTVWSSSVKMAPSTLRKPGVFSTPPPSVLRSLQKPKLAALKTLTPDPRLSPPPALPQPALVGVTSSVVEEYDPARPNDYEEYRREKKRLAREAEIRRELERRAEEERERERDRIGSNAAAPSSTGVINNPFSGEEAWRRRAAMSTTPAPRSPSPTPPVGSGGGGGGGGGEGGGEGGGGGFLIGKSDTVGLGVGAGGQMTAAQRMMAKMGWKEGQGLGRQEQGITTPLMAKKTDRRAGVIVNASEKKEKEEKKAVKGVSFNGPPTRVLLLRNMVGPGEVDDELEDEVASECAKYGTVTRVLIFEITEPSFPTDEAVRIFVQFERSEFTTKAYVDLDGRFFGGRVVRAAFYDEERFARNELAPLPGEIAGFC